MITKNIEIAVRTLTNGGLVAFPTETVYGLGGDAKNSLAINKIYRVKNRPKDHPLIIHIADKNDLPLWAEKIPPEAYLIAESFWPGPVTLILQKRKAVSALLTGGQNTIALRVPRHPMAKALLEAFGSGIAAPSANKFTHVSPTNAQDVDEELGESVDCILAADSACEVGLESTIIDLSTNIPKLLRPGMIKVSEIEAVLGRFVVKHQNENMPRASGMHQLHYAPKTKTHLLSINEMQDFLTQNNKCWLVLLSHDLKNLPPGKDNKNIQLIKMPNDAYNYARKLYQTLRAVDKGEYQHIVIQKVPEEEDWLAISDRLTKASAGR